MRRRWKIILATAGAILVAVGVFGWWIADRTIIARMVWREGLDAADAGNHTLAEERMSMALRKLPTHSDLRASAFTFRARSRIEVGKFDEAIGDADQAIRLDPSRHLAVALRGVAQYKLGRYDLAGRELDASLAMESKSALAHYYRGLVAERKGELDVANSHYVDALGQNQAFARALVGISRILRAKGLAEEADYYEKDARRINPNVSIEIE